MPHRRSVRNQLWRPADEAEATGNMAAFIEWCQATAAHAATGSGEIWAWEATAPGEFADALCRFAGLDPALGYRAALGRTMADGGTLVLFGAGGCHEIDAAAMLAGTVPRPIAALLPMTDGTALARQAADHLLRLDLRPDQRLLWPGPLDDPWPLGALFAGATLLVCETPPADSARLAAEQAALVLRRPA